MIQNVETKAFVYRPEITFGDTNIVGNVYFANFIRWQGACREKFLMDYCPMTIERVVGRELIMHTTSVSCDFKDPVGVTIGDTLRLEMRLEHLRGGRLTMKFDYHIEGREQRIAQGSQKICCKRMRNGVPIGTVFPIEMLEALVEFSSCESARKNIADAIDFGSESDIRPATCTNPVAAGVEYRCHPKQ